jgi:predicted Zn-dependent protease
VRAVCFASLALLFASTSASSQVLTSTVIHPEVSAPPTADINVRKDQHPLPAAFSAADSDPLPLPVTPVAPKPISIPNSVKALAAKYDVSKIGERNVANGVNFYSLNREIEMGREPSQEVEVESLLLTDPVITEYVNRIGQQLVRNSDAKVPFTIKVIQSDEVNAFALPGGFFYVNTGLILAVENEAELAGVMAHEIAHVAARHVTRNESKKQLFNYLSIPLTMVGGPAVLAVRDVTSIALPMGYMKFTRDAEREADLLGIQYAYKSGYDPRALIDLFERLDAGDEKKANILAKAFATHPMSDDRIKRAQQEISYLLPPKEAYIQSTSEFDQVKARLVTLMGGNLHVRPDKPTLRVRDQASPSGQHKGPVLHRRDSSD